MIRGEPLTTFGKLSCILADYDGVRVGWDWKGANGMRPCLRCCNVFKKDADVAGRIGSSVEITCTNEASLVERTDSYFENDVDLVIDAARSYSAGRIAKAQFEDIQKCVGQNFSPFGLAANRTRRSHMRPLSVLNQDRAHGILDNGIWVHEMSLFIESDTEMTMRDYEAFMKSDLRFPKSYATKGSPLWRAFRRTSQQR